MLPAPAAPELPRNEEPPAQASQLPAVVARMAQSEDPLVRLRAVEGMAALPAPVAVPALLRSAADSDEAVHGAALDALQALDSETVSRELLDLLESPEGWPLLDGNGILQPLSAQLGNAMLELLVDATAETPRRMLAAYCLGQMKFAPAAEALRTLLWEDDGALSYACLDALYWIDDPGSLEDWVRLSSTPDPWVQSYAATALARSGAQESLEPLYALASGQVPTSPDVQRVALNGLGAWPGHISIPYLISILRANHPLQPDTIAALRKAAGLDVGRYPASWFEWYREETAAQEAQAQSDGQAPPLMPNAGDTDLLNNVPFVPPGFSPGQSAGPP